VKRIRLLHIRLPRLPRRAAREPRPTRPKPVARPAGVLRGARVLALAAVAVLVAAASVASFMESYRALYDWAHSHGLSVRWSAVWPLQIDTFIAVGELALFIALVDGWQRRSRVLPWVVTLGGLAVSVAGNVGHVGWLAPVADKATAAVPPLAAAAALAVGLGVLKRVVEHTHKQGSGRWQPPAVARSHRGHAGFGALVDRRRDCGARGAGTVSRRGESPHPERPANQVPSDPRGDGESRRRRHGCEQRPPNRISPGPAGASAKDDSRRPRLPPPK
jgi:hypothetical protein